jgi:DNA polymerase-3 subunit epsilon
MSWLDEPMVGFDTETTGVSTSSDRIVTAALITRTGAGEPSVRTWLIDPGVEIPARATEVHGITTEFAREHGKQPADALAEIAQILASALAAGLPVVGFNVQFDLSILESELARHGLPTLADRLPGGIAPVVDPLVLDRHLDRWRRGKRRLIDMCETYGVHVNSENLHAADADVLATLDVVLAIASRYPALGTVELADLHSQQVEAHRVWATEFTSWLKSKGVSDDFPSPVWPVAPAVTEIPA